MPKLKYDGDKFIEYHIMDCLDGMKKMDDNSVDLILTDPPFKVSQKYGGGVDADNLSNVSKILLTIPEMSRILKPNRFAVIFYDNRILPFLFEAVKNTDFIYRKQIFLYRRWGNANRWVGWMQTTDPVCIFVNGYEQPFAPKIKGKVKHDVFIKKGPETENTGHPAQKPIEMLRHIIEWCSDENEIVFDPYLGSGSTMKAACDMGRSCIGFDNNPDYKIMIEKRCSISKSNSGNLYIRETKRLC